LTRDTILNFVNFNHVNFLKISRSTKNNNLNTKNFIKSVEYFSILYWVISAEMRIFLKDLIKLNLVISKNKRKATKKLQFKHHIIVKTKISFGKQFYWGAYFLTPNLFTPKLFYAKISLRQKMHFFTPK